MDVRTHTVKNGHTDMLKLIRYDPGCTTSETLRLRLDTVLDRLVMRACFFEENVCEILDRLRPLGELGFTLPELDEDGLT